MKKLAFFVFVVCIAFQANALKVINISGGTELADSAVSIPEYSIEYVNDGIVCSCKINNIIVSEDDLYPGSFHISVPGFSTQSMSGYPSLPYHISSFIAPALSSPTITLLSSDFVDCELSVAPARVPRLLCDTVKYSISNVNPIQPYSGFWPDRECGLLPMQVYREQKIIEVEINPVKYDYMNKVARVYTDLKFKISYGSNCSISDIYFEPKSMLNPNCSHELYLGEANSQMRIREPGSSKSVSNGYLILSIPEFKETLQEFVLWKKRMGYNVVELYDENWSADKVKERIRSEYTKNKENLYLLIVGDHSIVPADSATFYPIAGMPDGDFCLSDFPYTCMDGDSDTYPELYRGRWPVNNVYDLQTIIDKTIWYEQSPPTDENFYGRGSHFSFFEDGVHDEHDGMEDGIFVRTCEDVRDYLTKYYDFNIDRFYTLNTENLKYWPSAWNDWYTQYAPFSNELKYDRFKWNATPDSVVNSVNSGISYLMFVGHGGYGAWGYGNNEAFETTEIRKMNNYEKLPLLLSICCLSGNHSKYPCLVRDFLTKRNGGSMAAFAATSYGFFGYQEKFASLLINAIWHKPSFSLTGSINKGSELSNNFYIDASNLKIDGPFRQLGMTLDFALKGMRYANPSEKSKTMLYCKHIYHLFGDPSMYYYAEYPQVLDGIEVNRGNQGTNVYIHDGNAYIAFYDPISNKSKLCYGNEASYFTAENGGAKYVDVVVYSSKDVPYIDLGERYFGVIQDEPNKGTSILGYKDTRMGSVEIEYYLSKVDANSGSVEMYIVDPLTGRPISSWPLDRTITDVKNTIQMRCDGGVMIAYLMVGGAPRASLKIYVSK